MTDRFTPPACIAEMLSVDIVGDEVFLDGSPQVAVALTPEAALATGHALIAAALGLQAGKQN